jgi:predicted DNA-binding ribbon-helix-helix protein
MWKGWKMNSPVRKRSVLIAGRKTSVSLEQQFWEGLKEIARLRTISIAQVLDGVATARVEGNLSSAIRLFVLDHYRGQIERTPVQSRADGDGRDIAPQAIVRTPSFVTPPAFRKSA